MYRKQIIIAFLLFITAIATAQKADDIIGKYHLPNKLDVEIYKTGNSYSGKIIALNGFENGQTTDVKNPDKSKRDTPLLGKVIITNLQFDKEEKQWINGTMYGSEKGMDINLKITEMNGKEITVIGSKFILWKTLKWTRIDNS
jgi:uncharacterized protein (DUF2147 family)